jgi:hypothetical protein
MRSVARAAVAAIVLFFLRSAYAYRPFDSTDADVAELGEFELELAPLGYVYEPSNYGPSGQTLSLSYAVANFGFARGWELVVQGRGLLTVGKGAMGPRFAISDSGVFAKHVFKEGTLQGKTGISFAIEMGFLFPQVNGDNVGFAVDHIVSYRWKYVTTHFNFQISKTPNDKLDLFAGVILEGPHTWRVRPVAELAYENQYESQSSASILAGFIVRVRDELSLDLAGRVARIDVGKGGQPGAEVRAGLTLTFDTHKP